MLALDNLLEAVEATAFPPFLGSRALELGEFHLGGCIAIPVKPPGQFGIFTCESTRLEGQCFTFEGVRYSLENLKSFQSERGPSGHVKSR